MLLLLLRSLSPKSAEGRLVLAVIALGVLLALAGRRIVQLDAELAARPEVMDGTVDHRTEDVRRGPVKITRSVVTAPDGTRTVNSVREESPVEISKTTVLENTHKEIPWDAGEPRNRTRYVGIGVDPLNYARIPRLRAGLTFLGSIDVGVAYDARFSPVSGAFSLEAAYRF